jgi:secreted trypsin-like serine protease
MSEIWSRQGLRLAAAAIFLGLAMLAAPARSDAIVGGSTAPEGRWPWMAAVLLADIDDDAWAQYCGGVVIGRRRVLTAAHCALQKRAADLNVLVGRARLTADGGRRLRVKAISVYPGFVNEEEPSLDAAVLTLAQDAGVPPLRRPLARAPAPRPG